VVVGPKIARSPILGKRKLPKTDGKTAKVASFPTASTTPGQSETIPIIGLSP